MKRLVILTLMATGLAACGGGSSSVTPPAANTEYAFFTHTDSTGTSLRAFDPDAALNSAITTIPTTDLQYQAGIINGTVDPTTMTASNLHIGSVLYQDNGSFYSVATAKSNGLTVSQHSNYTGTVCDRFLTNNYLVFTAPGADATCHTVDDSVHAISTTMTSSDPVIDLPSLPVAVLSNDLNTVQGLLLLDGGSLVYTDETGQNARSLQTANVVSVVGGAGNNVLLNVDGNLEIFDGTTLSGLLYTPSVTGPLTRAISDGSNYYFFDGLDLYSLPMDGKSMAQKIASVPKAIDSIQLDVTPVYVHNDILVYTTHETYPTISNNTRAVYAVDVLSSVGPYPLVAPLKYPVQIAIAGYHGNYLYYNLRGASLSGDAAGVVTIDGSYQPIPVSAASWVGYSVNTSLSIDQGMSMDAMVLDTYAFDSSGALSGGNISVYDAATDMLRNNQGSLPAGVVKFSGTGYGERVYGTFTNTSGAEHLAGLNVNVANSLKQLDLTTAAVTDAPIM